ncbi:hypothetical protein G6F60_014675 [Rhizopus arrhizus]|nr:hypothetical protein G6F60_014675 [Rhizopus arrhizus]
MLHTQAEGDVLEHRHVLEQRIVLEYEADLTLAHIDRGGVFAGEQHTAGIGRLQPRDDAQQRGLAAAGRPEQHHELAVADVQVQRAHGLEVGIGLLDALQGYAGHISSASGSWRTSCRAHPSGRAVRWRPAPASWTP